MTQAVRSPVSPRLSPPEEDFGGIIRQPRERTGAPEEPDFAAIQESDEFAELRHDFRRFVFPVSVAFFLWYLTYVLLAAFAHGLMSHRLVGSVNVGLVMGLLQFVTTIAITVAYVRYARRRLDPRAAAIRSEVGR